MRLSVKLVLALVPIVAIAFAARVAAPAEAKTFTPSTGSFEVTNSEELQSQQFGNATFAINRNTISFTGSMSGTMDCIELNLSRASGAFQFLDLCDFTGSIEGNSGTAKLLAIGHSTGTDGSFAGRYFVNNGTGDLSGVSAFGHFQGTNGAGTYSGNVVAPGAGGSAD